MTNKTRTLNRRDILKLGAAAAGGALLSPVYSPRKTQLLTNGAKPNFIVLVFDAMAARHLSVHDYHRETTPNFERFAQRATVYHSHFAGSNFTTSGTASMLTGTYPWTHRAINHRGRVKPELESGNIFAYLGGDYFTSGFSHNWWANFLLAQMDPWLSERIPPASFSAAKNHLLMEELFPNDYSIAYPAYSDALSPDSPDALPASMLLGLSRIYFDARTQARTDPSYPEGLPNAFYVKFKLEDVLDGLDASIHEHEIAQKPFLQYFHVYPPHEPYAPHKDFMSLFRDRKGFVQKPVHPLVLKPETDRDLFQYNSRYDQYLANIDHEFGALLDRLEKSGILDTSYLMVTSDHGEVFERGMHGHGTALLFDSMLRIPLMIRAPGQTQRVDVHFPTSNLDLVPTILSLAGKAIPPAAEGQILPGLGGLGQPERTIYGMVALKNSRFEPFRRASVALHKADYKLIYYLGYGLDEEFELYDLANDRDEMSNLFGKRRDISTDLKAELLAALDIANEPYLKGGQ